ncbi:hypothetical protein LPB86_17780 [Pedobacter sp. MC2016-14]|uniref:hypothetical protein n=1 Tax=Pedobacter sp. MC2016-14 TaxID=2897327 RepID=UPI001E55FCBD|nr:hypothetical protein [Pedobacter sp. MC2016-14]MCD0490095.1 hypothetical protein [Pedobacter sp. MC2016-14]
MMMLKKSILALFLLSILFSCKKKAIISTVETAYWFGGGIENMILLKGTIQSDGTQTVTKLYDGGLYDPLVALEIHPGTKEIYWAEMDIEPVTSSNFTCYVNKGDTSGGPKQRILSLPQLVISAMAVEPVSRKLYYVVYDEKAVGEYLYRCNLDGTGNTMLFSSFKFGDVVSINIDGANNKIYVVENDLESLPRKESSVYKANLDGTGTPVLLYNKASLPIRVAEIDRFTGIAIDGSNLYIASSQGSATGTSYLFKGDVNGNPATTVISSGGSANHPISTVLGLNIDSKHRYLYWISRSNSTSQDAGVVYKVPLAAAATSTPKLIFKDINLHGGLFGPIEIGN